VFLPSHRPMSTPPSPGVGRRGACWERYVWCQTFSRGQTAWVRRSQTPYTGVTLQLQVGDKTAGLEFYTKLFGRGPDFSPHEDFFEWQVVAGAEVWWQIVVVSGPLHPLPTRLRLKVDDVRAATKWARTSLKVEPGQVLTLPGVVSFVNFEDPWGNRLGFYEDLVPSGQQPEPGGSVHDEALFVPDPPES
jgi:catechol 2,3-dioxygenase-like lactoylglutathione lyase family enzyme